MAICLALSSPLFAPARAAPPIAGEAGKFRVSEAGPTVPDVPFETSAGSPATLADYRGQVVLLNFWATWCPPCIREMPSLLRAKEILAPEGLTVIAMSEDRGGRAKVEPFYAANGLAALGFALDRQGALARAFKLHGMPTTILIDRQGRELGRLEGAVDWADPAILALLRYYMARG